MSDEKLQSCGIHDIALCAEQWYVEGLNKVFRLSVLFHSSSGGIARLNPVIACLNAQGSYSTKEIKFQNIAVWIELNFQDISDAVYHTNVAINLTQVLILVAAEHF